MAQVRGYEKLSCLMSRHSEYSIVRKFRELNYRNILYLQAELVHLEAELRQFTAADDNSDDPFRQHYGRHWPLLSASVESGHDMQWTTILKVRHKLEEYNKCLRDQRVLVDLGRPTKYNLDFLRNWLVRREMGNRPIISDDRHAWDAATEHDLVVLEDAAFSDTLSCWVSGKVIPAYHSIIGKYHKAAVDWDTASEVSWYSSSSIQYVIDILATTISCALPVGATIVLYFVQSMGTRLGILTAFTSLFAFSLALLTSAKRVEIFGATTAFAAVQVVFIGTNVNNATDNV